MDTPDPARRQPLPEIKGFLETSFSDWPGRVAAVVFVPRCNYRCPYCHNHRLVTAPETVPTWPVDAVFEALGRLRGWVDGVCVTGGEPTLHPGLPGLLDRFKEAGWAVKLDTNGSRPDAVAALVGAALVDAVAVDVKAPLEPIPYRRNAGPGADPEPVARTLGLLAGSRLPVELRTTVHPDLLSRDELVRLAGDLGRRFRGRSAPVRYTPQRCRVDDPLDPELAGRSPLDPDAFDAWARAARAAFDAGRTA